MLMGLDLPIVRLIACSDAFAMHHVRHRPLLLLTVELMDWNILYRIHHVLAFQIGMFLDAVTNLPNVQILAAKVLPYRPIREQYVDMA
jgi:hypothetical protein